MIRSIGSPGADMPLNLMNILLVMAASEVDLADGAAFAWVGIPVMRPVVMTADAAIDAKKSRRRVAECLMLLSGSRGD